ncbi:MAG: TVP38/TMEM64 family protein [Methyloceanibacter sp.]|nr:MAG: TVP38/TMEM64 family protein [Methyloceanibacter sp.]
MESVDHMPRQTASRLKRWWPLLLLASVSVIVVAMGWHRYLTLEQLAQNRESLRALIDGNYALALAAFAALYAISVALSIPGGVVLTVAGGFLFGWLAGGVVSILAATAGATVVYLVARTTLRDVLIAKAGPRLQRFAEGFREDAVNYLLFLRLVPVFPFWLVNLAPGLLGVGFWTYVLTTFVGIVPGTFAFSLAGNGLGSVFDAQQAAYESCLANAGGAGQESCVYGIDPGALLTTEVLVAIAALGVVSVIPVVAKKFRRRTA